MRETQHYPDPAVIGEIYGTYRSYDLVIDSRSVKRPDRTLFFALAGERTDGHDFILPLLATGVRHFVVRADSYRSRRSAIVRAAEALDGAGEPHFLLLPDPAALLRQLAGHHRRQFTLPVVAITGSNGKTIVKDWLVALLGGTISVCASPRSYNSRLGVPLSVWQLDERHELALFEVGISQPGDMEVLAEIVRPTAGVLTNLGTAHRSNFRDGEQHRAEKLRLFHGVDWVVVPASEPAATAELERLGTEVITWSGDGRTGLQSTVGNYDFGFPDLPAIYLDNARCAATTALRLGLPAPVLKDGLTHLRPLSNRLEQRAGRDGNTVINDSYSNDYSALVAALEFAETQDVHGRITIILGTVQDFPDKFSVLARLLRQRTQRIILVGADNRALARQLPGAHYFPNEHDWTEQLAELDYTDQTVLIKGASYERLDRVADALSHDHHGTRLLIDLSNLRQNFQVYRRRLPADCGVIAMTKASAYGSGAPPVARTLVDAGATCLAVAYPAEGRDLRRAGINVPILVLNAEPASFARLRESGLEPVVHNRAGLDRATAQDLPVHLEIDTGMGRLGFSPVAFAALAAERPDGRVASIFTHLAASEDPQHDDFTRQQLAEFDRLYANWTAAGNPAVPRHVLNSNGVTRFPAAAYELVRLGIGLYGIGDRSLADRLRPVLTLVTRVAGLSERRAGDTIGYGRRGRIGAPRRIAVLSIGYADGLPRLAGEGRFNFRINGRPAPTVGAICMDMCTVDVTDIAGVRIGTEATVFGPDQPIERLATAARTIPYEILTGIGPRVNRRYVTS